MEMRKMESMLPMVAMVLVQIGYAGMNVIAKMAMNSGMKPLVLVAYRQLFATLSLAPFAFYLERKTRPKITASLLWNIFLCSLTGVTGNQVLYFVGLQLSTPTIGCALTNVLPALTFLLAVIFRQESVGIKRISGQAKVVGTAACVGGAMLLSFYHGHVISIPESGIHLIHGQNGTTTSTSTSTSGGGTGTMFLGPLLILGSALSWALWFVLQARVGSTFPAPYTSTWLMCFMGSLQCVVIALGPNHRVSHWSLSSPERLVAALYSGIVCTGLAFSLTSWSIQRKGALYVSVFNPLLLIVVAVLSWAVLGEKLFLGTLVGAVLIIGGLYVVLWGKDQEGKMVDDHHDHVMVFRAADDRDDVEMQSPAEANGKVVSPK
ncbi:WAT1-related protein At1g09380 [Linum perenne]